MRKSETHFPLYDAVYDFYLKNNSRIEIAYKAKCSMQSVDRIVAVAKRVQAGDYTEHAPNEKGKVEWALQRFGKKQTEEKPKPTEEKPKPTEAVTNDYFTELLAVLKSIDSKLNTVSLTLCSVTQKMDANHEKLLRAIGANVDEICERFGR